MQAHVTRSNARALDRTTEHVRGAYTHPTEARKTDALNTFSLARVTTASQPKTANPMNSPTCVN